MQDVKDISRASIKASTHVTKLRDSWQHLLRDRATRSLTYNDEQFHILERIKMGEKAKCLTDLLNEESQLVIVRLTEVLSDWYKTAQAGFIQTEILAKDMSQFEKNLQTFLVRLNTVAESYQSDLENLTIDIKHYEHNFKNRNSHSNSRSLDVGYNQSSDGRNTEKDKKNNYRSTSRKEYTKTFNRGLKELTLVQEEVWNILKENAELVNQFQTLTLSILTPDVHGNHTFEGSAKDILTKIDPSLSSKSE